MTRTALYRRWETQHDFWLDLSRYLVFANDNLKPSKDLPWQGVSVPTLDPRQLPTMLEALRVGIGELQRRLDRDLRVLVRASLFAYADVPEIVAARRVAEQTRIQMLALLLLSLVDGMDHRFTAPLDAFGVSTALWCLADGLTVRAWRQPGFAEQVVFVDDGEGPQPWTLLAYAARALLTEQVTPGRRSLDEPDGTSGPEAADPQRAPEQPRWNPGQMEALEAARSLFLARVDPSQPVDHEHEISALGHVTVASVARACRVSRRAVYNVWTTSDSMRLDLMAELLAAEHRTVSRRLEPVLARPLDHDHLAAQVMSTLVRRPAVHQLWVGHVRLAYLVDGRHPGVLARNAAGTAGICDEYQRAVSRLWPADDRPSGGSLDDRQLATILSCLSDGANRLMRVLPEAVTYHGPGSGLTALVDSLVRHDPDAVRLAR